MCAVAGKVASALGKLVPGDEKPLNRLSASCFIVAARHQQHALRLAIQINACREIDRSRPTEIEGLAMTASVAIEKDSRPHAVTGVLVLENLDFEDVAREVAFVRCREGIN